MLAGRELDALVAEKVMGETPEEELGFIYPDGRASFGNSPEYTRQKCENYARQGFGTKLITRKLAKPYSTDIAAAWEVVNHSNAFVELYSNPIRKTWSCAFGSGGSDKSVETAETAPLAICLAALKAVGHDVTSRSSPTPP